MSSETPDPTGSGTHSDAVEPTFWAARRVESLLADVPTEELLVEPIYGLHGLANFDVRPPGSKSVTNRALVCAALATGTTNLEGVLFADDTVAMLEGLGSLGVGVEPSSHPGAVEVTGTGGVRSPLGAHLHARLSGTTARFLAPVAALLVQRAVLDGDEPLRRRPMGELVSAMRTLGAHIEATQPGDRLPMQIDGSDFHGGSVSLAADVSSQFLSALLLAAPAMSGGLEIGIGAELVSAPYVDMTLSVMADFGARHSRSVHGVAVTGSGYRSPGTYVVEPDASAASYFLAAAAVCGGRARIVGLDRTSMQGDLRFVDILDQMGMYVVSGDGWIEVRSTGDLQGVEVDMSDCSDVAQTLAVVATQASTPTRITGIGFIRAKETDRVAAVVAELQRLGVDAREEGDGFLINPGEPRPGLVQTYDDHRMAMSFAVLGLRFPGIRIADPRCVAKTYPGFWHDLGQVNDPSEETM